MLPEYYAARGWDADGQLTGRHARRLGLYAATAGRRRRLGGRLPLAGRDRMKHLILGAGPAGVIAAETIASTRRTTRS